MTMVEVIEKEITEDIERMADDLPLHRFVAAGNRNLIKAVEDSTDLRPIPYAALVSNLQNQHAYSSMM